MSVAENWQVSAGGVYVFTAPSGEAGEEYYSYLIVKHTLFEDKGSSIAVGGAVMFWGREEIDGPYPGWKRARMTQRPTLRSTWSSCNVLPSPIST